MREELPFSPVHSPGERPFPCAGKRPFPSGGRLCNELKFMTLLFQGLLFDSFKIIFEKDNHLF